MMKTTIDEFTMPVPLRLLNGGAAFLRKCKLELIDLSEQNIADAACRQTKLDDFGDPEFRESAKFVLETVDRAGKLHFMGRYLYRVEFLRLYMNRLRIINDIQQQPDIAARPIHRPFFIVSFPRTGTTLLYQLLTQDSNTRCPTLWQLLYPILPSAPQHEVNRRIKDTQQFLDTSFRIAPQIRKIAPIGTNEGSECFFALPNHFGYVLTSGTSAYKDWFLQRDAVPDYTMYRQQLQILQWQQPERHWVLKCPTHLWKLDALLTVFPDAAILQTHRHPAQMLASWCSLAALLYKLNANDVDLHRIGSEWLDMMKVGLSRSMTARAAQPERFYDVRYTELVKNPLDTIQRIYDHFGYSFTSEIQTAITHWLKNNPQHKHGTHRYSLEQFGLSESVIKRTFADYIEQFELT